MRVVEGDVIRKNTYIGIVVSRFNETITKALLEGAHEALVESGIRTECITTVWVPGAVEIPIALKKLATQEHYDGLIALGAVIKGETQHFDYVCQQVSDGTQQLNLELGIPISFGVLTTNTRQQALDRVGGQKGHKGQEAAQALVETISVLRKIERLQTSYGFSSSS